MSTRARNSLRQRAVDLDDLASMVRFVLDNGGEVEFGQHSYHPGGSGGLAIVTLRLGGRERWQGGHAVDTLRRLLIDVWGIVLADADTQATEAQVDEVLA